MDIARAMYLGGKIIEAKDISLTYSSYKDLGLRCPVCGEPVYLKKGIKRKTHFAHFHNSELIKICILRLLNYSYTTQNNWQNLILGRGQRREIFEQYFLRIIASNDKEFYIKIKLAQDRNYSRNRAYIIDDCIQYFTQHENEMIHLCCELFKDNNDDEDHLLNKQIACEAINYLCIKSTMPILKKLIFYNLFEICINTKELDLKLNQWKIQDICYKIVQLIIKTSWREKLSELIEAKNLTPREMNEARVIDLSEASHLINTMKMPFWGWVGGKYREANFLIENDLLKVITSINHEFEIGKVNFEKREEKRWVTDLIDFLDVVRVANQNQHLNEKDLTQLLLSQWRGDEGVSSIVVNKETIKRIVNVNKQEEVREIAKLVIFKLSHPHIIISSDSAFKNLKYQAESCIKNKLCELEHNIYEPRNPLHLKILYG